VPVRDGATRRADCHFDALTISQCSHREPSIDDPRHQQSSKRFQRLWLAERGRFDHLIDPSPLELTDFTLPGMPGSPPVPYSIALDGPDILALFRFLPSIFNAGKTARITIPPVLLKLESLLSSVTAVDIGLNPLIARNNFLAPVAWQVQHEHTRQYLADPPKFATKPKQDKTVAEETIMQLAEENNFPSRQAARMRIQRTGRNQQFNAKATKETIDKIYKLANEMNVPLGELLRLAVDALERAGASRSSREHFQHIIMDIRRWPRTPVTW
jgi:hypothetical protein